MLWDAIEKKQHMIEIQMPAAAAALRDPKRFNRRSLLLMEPGWDRDAIEGYVLMRDGKDYVNNSHRYDRALKLLTHAYDAAVKANACSLDLTRMSLWIGIATQENVDNDKDNGGPSKRNRRAIAFYKRGLQHARYVRDPLIVPMRMSLYNSLGVACQGGRTICDADQTMLYYQKARDIYRAHPELQREMARIIKKVEANSDRAVMRGGGSGGTYLMNCAL